MICPRCNGNKKIIGIFPRYTRDVPLDERKPFIEIDCFLCDSTGEVDEEYPYRRLRGECLREARIKKGMTLRKFCNIYGTDASTISQFEMGALVNKDDLIKIFEAYFKLILNEEGNENGSNVDTNITNTANG